MMKLVNKLVAAGILMAAAHGAMAQDAEIGVNAGTTVLNTATANFQVNGVPQTATSGNDGGFLVDRKIDLTVVRTASAYVGTTPGASASPSDTRAGIPFDVTNLSNSTMDIALVAANYNTLPRSSGADQFDASSFQIYLDVDGSGTF